MVSRITFSEIDKLVSILYEEITDIEKKEGRIKTGGALTGMGQDNKLDVLILNKAPEFYSEGELVVNEDNIRENGRQTYKKNNISESSILKQRLAVGTPFLKRVKPGDTIFLIRHN